jgi:hypothetical protein
MAHFVLKTHDVPFVFEMYQTTIKIEEDSF